LINKEYENKESWEFNINNLKSDWAKKIIEAHPSFNLW
jgi:hypothetical protein